MTGLPLTARQAWKALEAHYEKIRTLHLRTLFADDPTRGERLTAEAVGLYLDYSKNRVTDETLALLRAAGRGVRPARAHRRHVPRRQDQRHRESRRPARRAARPAWHVDRGGRQERRARGPRRARRDGRLLQPRAERRLEGAHRQAHPQRRQHRHRRLRPRPRDGVRGAQALQRSRADVSLRLERRRDRLRRGDPRSRPGGDALHRLVEDLHDARDDDQRRERAPVAARGARRRRQGGGQALRRRLDERRRRCRSSASTPRTCSGSGTGSAGAIRWIRRSACRRCSRSVRSNFRAMLGRLPPDGRAFPHRAVRAQPAGAPGPVDRLVHRLLRRRDRGASCPTSNT